MDKSYGRHETDLDLKIFDFRKEKEITYVFLSLQKKLTSIWIHWSRGVQMDFSFVN